MPWISTKRNTAPAININAIPGYSKWPQTPYPST